MHDLRGGVAEQSNPAPGSFLAWGGAGGAPQSDSPMWKPDMQVAYQRAETLEESLTGGAQEGGVTSSDLGGHLRGVRGR